MMDDKTKKLLETRFDALVAKATRFDDLLYIIGRRLWEYRGMLAEGRPNSWFFRDDENPNDTSNDNLPFNDAIERALDFLIEKTVSDALQRKNKDADESE